MYTQASAETKQDYNHSIDSLLNKAAQLAERSFPLLKTFGKLQILFINAICSKIKLNNDDAKCDVD